jgi:hypothetical protein
MGARSCAVFAAQDKLGQTMPAARSSRPLTLAGAAAILPIAAEFIDKLAVHPRPFWAHDYDPETIYFYQSLSILDGHAPLNVDHPGIPVQLLGAAIAIFTGRSPLQFDAFRAAAYVVSFALTIAAAIVLARVLFRESSPWLAVAGVWTYFLAPMALERDIIWSAEILYFPLGVVSLIAVARGRDFPAGVAIGLCVATKFLFLGWAVALIVVARRRLHALAGLAIGFVAGTCVAMTKYPYMLGWMWQNASHTGAYGRGAVAMPDLGATLYRYVDFASHAKGWLLWIAAVAVLVWLARATIDRRLLAFSLVAMAITLLLPFRAPAARYLLPAGVAVVGMVAAARGVPRFAAIAACALAALLLAKNLVSDDASHRQKIAGQRLLRAEIEAAVHGAAPRGVVVYGWRVPEPSFALRIEATEPSQLDLVARRYPDEGHFNDWERRIYLPPGARRWDVAVIDESLVDQFPEPLGRPVAAIGAYRVFANPR